MPRFGLALLRLSACLALLACGRPPSDVPLRVLEGDDGQVFLLVPLFLEGTGPYEFGLDTGATRTSVDETLARGLGLVETGRARVAGVGGNLDAPIFRVESWLLGSEVPLVPSQVLGLALGGPDGLAGLLGSDVLATFGAVRIDYDRGVLTVE